MPPFISSPFRVTEWPLSMRADVQKLGAPESEMDGCFTPRSGPSGRIGQKFC